MPSTTEVPASRSDRPRRGAAQPRPSAASSGERAVQEGRIRVVAGGADRSARESTSLAGLHAQVDEARRAGGTVWIDLEGPTSGQVQAASEALGLHPLLIEDIRDRNQRAKIEQFDGVIHIVLFALLFPGEVEPLEVDVVLGDGFLLTAHDPGWDPRTAEQMRLGPGSVLGRGPDYLLYVLADTIVDGYFPILDRLADEIDELEDQLVMTQPSPWALQRLFGLKRELITLRRALSPTREIFNQLTNRELGEVDPGHVIYFRDVYDHLIRVTDEVDSYREMVAGALDIYLTSVNNTLSVIMKRLTGVTVILAGIGAVAGIFGMSEAATALAGAEGGGFWLVSLVTVAGALAVAVILRRIDWI
ncbi:MAG TPA: magnesium transporter CorA family protein [Candidatus Limnocylindrales bacterium]|jgi:magnesium transporter